MKGYVFDILNKTNELIMNYTFDFNAVSLAPLLQGLWVSLELTAAANVIGIVFGFALALLIMSPYRIVRLPFMPSSQRTIRTTAMV